jgi:acyl-CoA synthetase (AMP-forming)/AMP-acid ligase II
VRGNAPALFEGTASLTFGDWNEYADMLADTFVARGLGLDDVIAVRCRNRIEWAVIALACAKIDARVLTLDADMPPRLLRERLIASRAAAVIVGDTAPVRLAAALDGLNLRLRATMDAPFPGFFNFWDLFPPVAQRRFGRAQPSMLAWSSGPGARPVAVPRRRNAAASISRAPMPDHGVSLITTPLHRIWGCVQFWGALSAGRAIVLTRAFNAMEALKLIRQHHVTNWSALPEAFAELHRLGAQAVRHAETHSLTEVVIGGAAAPWILKAWLVEQFGPIVSEAYGSTETGLISVLEAPRFQSKRGSCGRPIRGASVEIRDADGRRLPPGMVGQVWARTQRTLECEGSSGTRHMHRDDAGFVATGDAGRIDEEGFLYITGRAAPRVATETRAAG